MIPIQLTIEGLYSYQERQKIDFTHLTDAGLFGIFGSVGSGKSSILESISFVLYGETERLNARDKRAYNMMNLKSNKSFIEFDFINYENKIFRAARDFKRNSKKFDDVKPSSVVFYEKIDEKWIPLEHTNAEKILGLSYANFKRTIIIPQGQFKEFLELGATERTNMMKEIFGLQRFDLQKKTSILAIKNKSELDQLDGELRGYETITEEQISQQKDFFELEDRKLTEKTKVFKNIEEKYQNLKNLKQEFEELQSKKANFEILESKKKEIDIFEVKTTIFETTSRVFKPLFSEKDKLTKELNSQIKQKAELQITLKETESNFVKIQQQIAENTPKYEALEQTKIEENDLNLMMQISTFSEEIKSLKERTKNGAKKVNDVNENLKLVKNKKHELTTHFDKLKQEKLNSSLVANVGNWFTTNKNLVITLQKQKHKTEDYKQKIAEIFSELQPYKITIENYKDEFKTKDDALEIRRKEIDCKKTHLEVQEKLSLFANSLHDGENCPLCGSLEHPEIVKFDDVKVDLAELNLQLSVIENNKKRLQKELFEVEKILSKKEILEAQLTIEIENLKASELEFEKHQKEFIWEEFDATKENNFIIKREKSFAVEKQLESIALQISNEQKSIETEQENLEKYNKALETFRINENELDTKIKTTQSNLKILDWENFKVKSSSEILELHENLSKSNREIEKKYQENIRQEKEISPKLTELKTHLSHLEKRILEVNEELITVEKSISENLLLQKIENIEIVTEIISQEIDVEASRKIIQQFRIDYQTLKNSIVEIEEKLKGSSFNEELFIETEKTFNNEEAEIKKLNDEVVKLKSEIERLTAEYIKKEHLLKNFAALEKRALNLKTMTNLFAGPGFVHYVSSIYLRQLCDHANIRFHKMTRNQLSLQLNESNDFEIIDYLNEGRSRSVKTLSGGQSFQVSLSLALALAESVQTNAKAEKNFFFIDEGFGTQDLESVNIVFETLMNLQKENRIVGIISHVEELKEKIPVSLNITKDDEKGSIIEII